MQIMCSKGCGSPITVTKEVIDEATKHNAPINVSHEVCPRDREHQPKYVLTVYVHRHDPHVPNGPDDDSTHSWNGVELSRGTAEVIAPTFADAFDDLTKELTERWQTISQLQHIVEENIDAGEDPEKEKP